MYSLMRIWLLTAELHLRVGNLDGAELCVNEARLESLEKTLDNITHVTVSWRFALVGWPSLPPFRLDLYWVPSFFP